MPHVKVECVLTNPLLVEHVGPVLRVLQQRGVSASFVSLPPARRFVSQRRAKHALHERCLAAAALVDLACSTASDPRADIALTALGSNQLQAYRGIKLKVRYGVTLHRAALHHNRAMTYGFDGMLVHGAFERDLFSRWMAPERIKLVGVPRHAAYLAKPLTKAEARAQLGLRADRPVIAYLPTWSVQSSLHSFIEPLAALTRSHQLVIKPHALSLGIPEERAALAALERSGARIIPHSLSIHSSQERSPLEPCDERISPRALNLGRSPGPPNAELESGHDETRSRLMAATDQHNPRAPARHTSEPRAAAQGHGETFSQLIAAADLVLADATSGAATEAALLAPDTPLLLLGLRAPTELFREIEALAPLVQVPDALPSAVARQLQHDEQRAQRAGLCSRLFFTEQAGPRASELAADAILELARMPQISRGPGLLDRVWPRAAQLARGRAITLAIKWAPIPPRDLRKPAAHVT